MASKSDMPGMRCMSIGGIKNQHDAISESFATTKEIIISLTTYFRQLTLDNLLSSLPLLFSSLLDSDLSSSFCPSQWANLC